MISRKLLLYSCDLACAAILRRVERPNSRREVLTSRDMEHAEELGSLKYTYILYSYRRCCEMIHRVGISSRKVLCSVVALILLCAPVPAVCARSTMVVLTTGSARAVVDGRTITMLVPPMIDQVSQQTLVPIEFVARQFGFGVSLVPQSAAVTLSSLSLIHISEPTRLGMIS